jgi:hypothetical protein
MRALRARWQGNGTVSGALDAPVVIISSELVGCLCFETVFLITQVRLGMDRA